MATKQIKLHLSVHGELSGLNKIHSALDHVYKASAHGFKTTKSALSEMAKTGIASITGLNQQVATLQKTNTGTQQAVLQNAQAQALLNQEMQAGTVAGVQQVAVLKQLQDQQTQLAQQAKTSQQAFQASRQELQTFLGAVTAGTVLGSSALGGITGTPGISNGFPTGSVSGSNGGFGVVYSHNPPTLGSTLGLPANTPIGNILGGLFTHGIGPISGQGVALGGLTLASLTLGNQNRAVSGLGGAASGALIGTSILPGIGTAIGAAIGGIVGLFTGGDGSAKTHDANIANQGFAQLDQILDDYNNYLRDYATSVDDAYKVWDQMVSQWTRKQSAPSQLPYFNQIITAMQQTEEQRDQRQQLQSALAVPEFSQGGVVGGASGSPVLATVHAGEFVMTRQAVDRIGTSALQGLNQGSSGAAGGSGGQLSIEPASYATLSNFLTSNPQALDQGLLVVLRRGGPASKALRG